jgi:hypothetical protein
MRHDVFNEWTLEKVDLVVAAKVLNRSDPGRLAVMDNR